MPENGVGAVLDTALQFTDAYKKHTPDGPAVREAMCISCLYPAALEKPLDGDLFCGRLCDLGSRIPVDFSTQKYSQIGYQINIPMIRQLAHTYPDRLGECEELIRFWKRESTFVKIREAECELPELKEYVFPHGVQLDGEGYMRASRTGVPHGSGFISGSFDTRTVGLYLDYGKLLRLGLLGLRGEVEKYAALNGDGEGLYRASLIVIGTVAETCEYYARLSDDAYACAPSELKDDIRERSEILRKLKNAPPRTLREAIQLMWLWCLMTRSSDYGRMDVYFCDFLEGVPDGEIIRLLTGLWEMIRAANQLYDSRIIVGGLGRPDEKAADRFALLAMEATRRFRNPVPVLTLRIYKDQNPELFDRALDVIGEGCLYPLIYNDDVYVGGTAEGMNIPYGDAVEYLPLGCGEITLARMAAGSPNSTLRIPKALEAVLHNGRDALTGELIGIETGEPEELDTFGKLVSALEKQLHSRLAADIRIHEYNRRIAAKECALVMQSMLLDDCLARGKSIYTGGIRYFGANVEGFGMTNTADSLTAIKHLVYDTGEMTLRRLTEILDADFEGYEAERRKMLSFPKYGNGEAETDGLLHRLEAMLNQMMRDICGTADFHYYTLANVNPGGITVGHNCGATADGRKCATPFAIGNSPSPGADKSGLTALLRSTAGSPPCNGGYITNLNLSGNLINKDRGVCREALLAYFGHGGLQLNITVYDRGELEKALVEPEKYGNLMVRVGGYSARFVELDRETQKHIMDRFLY